MTSEGISYFPCSLTGEAKAEGSTPASSPDGALSNSEQHAAVIAPHGVLGDVSDDELLAQVANGSKDALSILFRRHAKRVFNVSQRILNDEAESQDSVQEVFIRLFQKADQFDAAKGSAVSWIIQIAYHRAFDRRKYLISRLHYRNVVLDEERINSSLGQVSITKIAARMLFDRLRDELSAGQMRTLELYLFEGYSFDEIADQTGQSLGSVRNQYYRGLKKLHSYVFPESSRNEQNVPSERKKRI
jgi:RNA polymerase sigma-70 factor (ECF subfamily)